MMLFKGIFCHKKKGFTLIELLITMALLGVLSVVSINYFANDIEESKFDETRKELEMIKKAIQGDETLTLNGERISFGFVGDIGRVPQTLAELTAQGTIVSWALDSTLRTSSGWNGPYVSTDWTGQNSLLQDAWGRNYTYNPATNPVTIQSLGADGLSGGTGFNSDLTLSIPIATLKATIHGFISNGTSPYLSTATIELYSPNGTTGALSTNTYNLLATDKGYFSFPNVPFGNRSIQVFIPSKASPTTILGPAQLIVDKTQFVIPNEVFNLSTGSSCPLTSDVTASGNMNKWGGNKKINFAYNVTAGTTIEQMTVVYTPSSVTATYDQAYYNCTTNNNTTGGTLYQCAGPPSYTPCPAGNSDIISINPTMTLTTGRYVSLSFSGNINAITALKIHFKHNKGCSEFTIN